MNPSDFQNERIAFRRMAESPKMRVWMAEQVRNWETGQTIEQKVAEMMVPENLRFEVKNESLWLPLDCFPFAIVLTSLLR